MYINDKHSLEELVLGKYLDDTVNWVQSVIFVLARYHYSENYL